MAKSTAREAEHNTQIPRPSGEPGRHDEGPPGGRFQRLKPNGEVEVIDNAGRPFGSEPVGEEEKDDKLAQQAAEIEQLKAQLVSANKAEPEHAGPVGLGLPPVTMPPPPGGPPE